MSKAKCFGLSARKTAVLKLTFILFFPVYLPIPSLSAISSFSLFISLYLFISLSVSLSSIPADVSLEYCLDTSCSLRDKIEDAFCHIVKVRLNFSRAARNFVIFTAKVLVIHNGPLSRSLIPIHQFV